MSGKSAIFRLLFFLWGGGGVLVSPEKPIIVVICPLVSLNNANIQELRFGGFSAVIRGLTVSFVFYIHTNETCLIKPGLGK